MILGMLIATVVGIAWILGQARWQQMDPQDPEKVLAQEVIHAFATRIQ